MFSFVNRLRVLKNVKMKTENAEFYFRKDVKFYLDQTSCIEVSGIVNIGFCNKNQHEYPTYQTSCISLGKNAKLIFKGNVFIAGGTSLAVKDDGEFIFEGNNYIARNSTFICSKKISYGINAASSWNFIGIDDDGHVFYHVDGTPIKRKYSPLIIEDNVAIQVNVTIPKGITIGKNSIIGASTTIRKDIPPNHLVYAEQNIKLRDDTTFGFHLT